MIIILFFIVLIISIVTKQWRLSFLLCVIAILAMTLYIYFWYVNGYVIQLDIFEWMTENVKSTQNCNDLLCTLYQRR